VWSAKQPREARIQGWPLIVGGIKVKHRWAMGRGQRRGLLIRNVTPHVSRRDVSDLVAIDKSKAVLGGYCDSVELIQLRYLQDMFDLAELGTRRAEHGSVRRQGKVRDLFTFVHDGLLRLVASDSTFPAGQFEVEGVPIAGTATMSATPREGRPLGSDEVVEMHALSR
jgi:hypothetical protein